MIKRAISNLTRTAVAVAAVLGACQLAFGQNPSDVGSHPKTTRSPLQVASDWGLVGSWSVDCATPPSQDNVQYTYAGVSGGLFYQRNQGSMQDSNPVISAGVDPDDKLDFVIDFSSMGQKRRNIIVKEADGSRYRAFDNSDIATGAFSVKDGKFTGNGQTTPWLNRCK